jgi:hypothetical protein
MAGALRHCREQQAQEKEAVAAARVASEPAAAAGGGAPAEPPGLAAQAGAGAAEPELTLLERWLLVEDEPDEDFLQARGRGGKGGAAHGLRGQGLPPTGHSRP